MTKTKNNLLVQELRAGWLGVGDAYQPLDALGVALGAYFLYEGATGKGSQWLTASLGAIMIFIHAERFFYAPKSRDGLLRLAKALKLSPHDFAMIQKELQHGQTQTSR